MLNGEKFPAKRVYNFDNNMLSYRKAYFLKNELDPLAGPLILSDTFYTSTKFQIIHAFIPINNL